MDLPGRDARGRLCCSDGHLGVVALLDLVKRIAEDSDYEALEELHSHRPLFRYGGEAGLLMAEYVDRLRCATHDKGLGAPADGAYDLTIDKFSRLPGPRGSAAGPDCRNYYSAFLRTMDSAVRMGVVAAGSLDEELLAATRLQGLVRRHFRLSLKECWRNGSMTRYVWCLPGGSLSLLMPAFVVGRHRQLWLTRNVPDPRPSRPGERERVQAIIDNHRWHEIPDDPMTPLRVAAGLSMAGDCGRVPDRLGEAVAAEKAADIAAQRPAIQDLGKSKLEGMIRRIFDDLADGALSDGAVAREYGLAKATYSRFAGSRWNGEGANCRSPGEIPDLWRNTAKVLASTPEFVEAARDAGVWARVRSIAGARGRTGKDTLS